jgi:putative endonuclease
MSLTGTRTGKRGEDLAAASLEKAGYRILERNYRCRFGEIDIIAEEGVFWCSLRSSAAH